MTSYYDEQDRRRDESGRSSYCFKCGCEVPLGCGHECRSLGFSEAEMRYWGAKEKEEPEGEVPHG